MGLHSVGSSGLYTKTAGFIDTKQLAGMHMYLSLDDNQLLNAAKNDATS
jgi:hypothetical protein